jgi:biopolymer transport protein ExbD
MNFSPKRREDPSVDLTPMIDVVFQLVLFFMVTTTFASTSGLQIDLPRANAQQVVLDDDDVDVWLACSPPEAGGCDVSVLHVDEAPADLPTLEARCADAAAKDPNTLVVVRADRGVAHGEVVAVMDRARARGLTRLAIATDADAPTPIEEGEGPPR